MKKLFTAFLILFLVGSVKAQNLNFKDTNGLKVLLCSHSWIRYGINTDSAFSDRIMDSVKYYANGTFYQSSKPVDDTLYDVFRPQVIAGKWYFGSTGKISRTDTLTGYIYIVMQWTRGIFTEIEDCSLIDWHRIKDSRYEKICRGIDSPFVAFWYSYPHHPDNLDWDRRYIWQYPRQFKKSHNR